MGNAAAFRALDSRIAMLKIVADLPDECVPAVADAIDKETKRTIVASTDPDGVPWKPKQDGGGFRFVTPSDIVTGAIGRTIITRIKTRHVVLHHLGYARGDVERRVIPVGRIPSRMNDAIKKAVVAQFERITKEGEA